MGGGATSAIIGTNYYTDIVFYNKIFIKWDENKILWIGKRKLLNESQIYINQIKKVNNKLLIYRIQYGSKDGTVPLESIIFNTDKIERKTQKITFSNYNNYKSVLIEIYNRKYLLEEKFINNTGIIYKQTIRDYSQVCWNEGKKIKIWRNYWFGKKQPDSQMDIIKHMKVFSRNKSRHILTIFDRSNRKVD
jgi:hypothetical protein